MRWMALAALLAGPAPAEEPEAWVFFSPDSPDASRIFRELEGRRVRPVLLVERYAGKRGLAPAFLATVRASGGLRVVDEEGLREAVRLGIRELPALAVRRGGRTHVAAGTRLDVREVLGCSK